MIGIATGYHIYGVFDTVFTFGVFMALVLGVAKDPSMFAIAMIVLFSYLPNVILYFVQMCEQSPGIRKAYFICLQFKLIVFAFVAPLVIIRLISNKNVGIYEGLC